MKVFVIIATFVACTWAAPTADLLHPSPVNSDVLVAVKPEEKVELITDPKEIAKLKGESKQPLYPTVLPKDNEQHITKASHQKRDIPVPLVAKHHHPEESSTEKQNSEGHAVKDHVEKEVPLILNDTSAVTQQNKRETPTTLVPKHDNFEESEKGNNKNSSLQNPNHQEPQRTVSGHEPTLKVEQQQTQESKGFVQHLKRDTSIPVVSKLETSVENKNMKSENSPISRIDHMPHLPPSNNHEKQIYHEV